MTYVIITTSIAKRQKIMQDLREKLTVAIPPGYDYKVVQGQVNRIDIMQAIYPPNKEVDFILIRRYVVVIIPVIVNFESLQGFYGDVNIDATDLLNDLYCAIRKLKNIQGLHKKGSYDAKYKQLADSLIDL